MRWFLRWQKVGFRRVINGALALIGPANGAGGAKTRKSTPCQRAAKLPVGRCRLHGGASTGPKTDAGLARLTTARATHGRFTKKKRLAARQRAEQGRQMCGELAELEAWFVDYGHLEKNGAKIGNSETMIVFTWGLLRLFLKGQVERHR